MHFGATELGVEEGWERGLSSTERGQKSDTRMIFTTALPQPRNPSTSSQGPIVSVRSGIGRRSCLDGCHN